MSVSVSEKLLLCLLSPALLTVTAQVGPIRVYGLITQSVSLAPTEHLAQPVEEVLWHYISNGTRHRLADYRNQRLSIRHSQFSQRLDADNSGTRLWIRELRSEDTGSYTAFIALQGTAHTVEMSFTLTVYEPVPTPDIKMEMEQISPDWCNFTLHCSAPTNPSALSYSWMYRHKGRYQPYPNGTTIRVSLQPESWDGEYLCLVQNPVGQNYVSITAREICNGTLTTKVINGKTCWIKVFITLPILTALSLSVGVLIIVTRNKKNLR
ncbi:T-lymphocyte surface antigen Ly-9 isoform X1 [Xenopus tropicalis]|uniref:T-lymphocyte surface antigen Ly-9 n=1 Tax=Xenopus tropicalis TaxID=8364 RepID=A0A803KDP1_XENTR|nr:T-lymphocyte surface antigen Ly-9 isoform X1 [Xenopus tropicalis]